MWIHNKEMVFVNSRMEQSNLYCLLRVQTINTHYAAET